MKFIKQLLQPTLQLLAKLYLWKYKPMIVGVTGNAGKTSTKEVIGAVLGHAKKVRISAGNLNNELGLPLTIIGDWGGEYYEEGASIWFWSKVLFFGFLNLFKKQNYPEVLVLEYGADHPGDIKKLSQKFKPHISVVTTVGDTPVHIEFFKNADALASEKSNLVKFLSSKDYAILNQDDQRVLGMKSKTKARVLTYGFDSGATVRISDVEYTSNGEGRPTGVTFKLNKFASTEMSETVHFVPVRISGSLGKSQAWSSAAAATVASVFGMNMFDVAEVLSGHHGPKGRLKIIKGIKNSNIIDDTYNASPASTHLALETLLEVSTLLTSTGHISRKVVVLGDMLELGEHSEKAHRDIGLFAGEVGDILVCVGSQARYIGESAGCKLSADKIFVFDNSNDAKTKVHELVQDHDLILVKGSQGVRMEKIVEEIMAEPENKRNLLVRQSIKWLSK